MRGMRLQSGWIWIGLVAAALGLAVGCLADKDESAFGNSGDQREGPAQDTGPWNVDTGPEDTASDATDDWVDDTSMMDTGEMVEDTGFDIEGEGYQAGDIAFNLVANNQNDDPWKLYQQFQGLDAPPWNVTVLVFGASYQSHFMTISGWLQDVLDQANSLAASVGSDSSVGGGVFLIDDATGSQASKETAAAWASANGLDTVLYESSPARPIAMSWNLYYQSKAKLYLIGPDMTIEWVADTGHTDSDRLYEKIEDLILSR